MLKKKRRKNDNRPHKAPRPPTKKASLIKSGSEKRRQLQHQLPEQVRQPSQPYIYIQAGYFSHNIVVVRAAIHVYTSLDLLFSAHVQKVYVCVCVFFASFFRFCSCKSGIFFLHWVVLFIPIQWKPAQQSWRDSSEIFLFSLSWLSACIMHETAPCPFPFISKCNVQSVNLLRLHSSPMSFFSKSCKLLALEMNKMGGLFSE